MGKIIPTDPPWMGKMIPTDPSVMRKWFRRFPLNGKNDSDGSPCMGKMIPTDPSVMRKWFRRFPLNRKNVSAGSSLEWKKKFPRILPEYEKNVEYVDPLMQTLIQTFTKQTSDNLSCQESKEGGIRWVCGNWYDILKWEGVRFWWPRGVRSLSIFNGTIYYVRGPKQYVAKQLEYF